MRHSPGSIKMSLGGVLAILEGREGPSVSVNELPQFLGPGHVEQVGGGREGGCRKIRENKCFDQGRNSGDFHPLKGFMIEGELQETNKKLQARRKQEQDIRTVT